MGNSQSLQNISNKVLDILEMFRIASARIDNLFSFGSGLLSTLLRIEGTRSRSQRIVIIDMRIGEFRFQTL